MKAIVRDTNTSDGSPLTIVPKQILLKEGIPYAVFSQNGMRYEEFELIDEDKPVTTQTEIEYTQ